MSAVADRRGRTLRDLRISVTDRCNFRCRYCMPREIFGAAHQFSPRQDLLTFAEITEVAEAAVAAGVQKIRLTGGEPLLRHGIADLVAMLRAVNTELDIAMTTNGVLLPRLAHDLRAAGLNRLTVSLDALDDRTFKAMTDSKFSVTDVLRGIETAQAAGFGTLKINAVIKSGQNENAVLDLAEHFRGTGHIVRFIEYMDVGNTNNWSPDQVANFASLVDLLGAEHPLVPLPQRYPGEVARRYRYADGSGEVGFITSVSQPFCGSCTRARVSSTGELHTCLFSSEGLDLRAILRGPRRSNDLYDALTRRWSVRDDGYSEQRSSNITETKRIEMSYIGG